MDRARADGRATWFEALFRSDHYFSGQGVTGRGSTDAWTLATQVFPKIQGQMGD